MKTVAKFAISLTVLSFVFALPNAALCEDVNQIFKKVNDLIEAGNFPKAMEELDWAKKEIEKMHSQKLQEFFKDEIAGFKGAKFNSNSALGFMNVEREYVGENQQKVTMALTGGSGGSGPLGGLAAFGKMAAMMGGQQQGQDVFRIKGRTANLENRNRPKLQVFLDSGSILELEAKSKDGSEESLKKMAEAVDLDGLDAYLKGEAKKQG